MMLKTTCFLVGVSCSLAVSHAAQNTSTIKNGKDFVSTSGSNFVLGGENYRFAGTNCYYLIYQSEFMVDNVLSTASSNGFDVIRTWAFIDIGYENGSASVDSNGPIKNGIYFQYFDPSTNRPAYNDDGLVKLDYVLYKAAEYGIKILLTLTNNWSDFGGMDQYLVYKQLSNIDPGETLYHDDFYSDSIIKEWYKDYVTHLVSRVNTYNDIKYGDDPSIFGWELSNEPRCQGTGKFGTSNNCVLNYAVYETQPIANKTTIWVDEMSRYIKSIDSNHMIGVGDEGWFCEIYQSCPDIVCDCYYGIDTKALIELNNVDYLTIHLYPDQWGKTYDWGNEWILNHTILAHETNKPMLLGEYGARNSQSDTYKEWTNTVYNNGTNGDLFWMISGRDDPGGNNPYWVPNYDGYAVYCPNKTQPQTPGADKASCGILSAHAAMMKNS